MTHDIQVFVAQIGTGYLASIAQYYHLVKDLKLFMFSNVDRSLAN